MDAETSAPVRPIAATLVAALAVVWGAVLAVSGALELRDAHGTDASLWAAAFELSLACLALVIAYGAFRVRRWGWVLFMTWAVWVLTVNLLRVFFFDDPRYVPLVVGTLTVLLLTPLDVQVAFRVRKPPTVRLGDAPRDSLGSV